MSTNALIGSGFFAANDSDFERKFDFLTTVWLPRLGNRDIVIVDNSEPPTQKLVELTAFPNMRVIQVMANLGHVGSMLGKSEPKLGGWSLSWMIPAMIAYSEKRDFIYYESDALAFGQWEESIYGDMQNRGLLAAFGDASPLASCEQSIFIIKREMILDFTNHYLAIPESDGIRLPEDKFVDLSRRYKGIGNFSLPCGRNRPVPFDLPSFFAQKWTDEEMAELRKRKMI